MTQVIILSKGISVRSFLLSPEESMVLRGYQFLVSPTVYLLERFTRHSKIIYCLTLITILTVTIYRCCNQYIKINCTNVLVLKGRDFSLPGPKIVASMNFITERSWHTIRRSCAIALTLVERTEVAPIIEPTQLRFVFANITSGAVLFRCDFRSDSLRLPNYLQIPVANHHFCYCISLINISVISEAG